MNSKLLVSNKKFKVIADINTLFKLSFFTEKEENKRKGKESF